MPIYRTLEQAPTSGCLILRENVVGLALVEGYYLVDLYNLALLVQDSIQLFLQLLISFNQVSSDIQDVLDQRGLHVGPIVYERPVQERVIDSKPLNLIKNPA